MFELAIPWWSFILRTAIVYLALLIGLRIFGRRELGQMTPFDLVVILLIANALQNAMVGPDTSVTGGLASAFTLLAINWVLSRLRARLPWLRKAAEGEPILLVSGGQVLSDRLSKENIDSLTSNKPCESTVSLTYRKSTLPSSRSMGPCRSFRSPAA